MNAPGMDRDGFVKWQARFRKAFLSDKDDGIFLSSWLTAKSGVGGECLADYSFEQCMAAIISLQADARIVGVWPRYYLPLVLDVLREKRAAQAKPMPPPQWEARPGPTSQWNQRMLALGIITKKEFKKREAPEQKGVAT